MPAPDIAGRLLPATGRMSRNFEQFFDPDRQLADANAKRMVDGIGDGSGRAHVGELANALHAGWVVFAVLLGDADDFDLVGLRVHGNEIVGQIVVDVARPGFVDLGCLVQRGADAPDHAAHVLAACGAGIHDAAGGERTDNSRHTDFPGKRMDAHLDELRTERVHELFAGGAPGHGDLTGVELLDRVRFAALRNEFRIFLDGSHAEASEQVLGLFLTAVSRKPDAAFPIGRSRGAGKLAANGVACLEHGGAGTRRGIGASGHRRRRKTGVAKLDLHRGKRHTEALRRDLTNHRVGAVADLMRGNLHPYLAARQHPYPRGGGTDVGRVDRGRTTQTDEPIAVAHRLWLRFAARPVESLVRLIVALHQGPARIGLARDRVLHRIVDAAELVRIDGELGRELVHRALERVDVRHDGRRAHEARRVAVGTHGVDFRVNRAEIVHPRAVLDPRHDVRIGPRRHFPAFMAVADDLTVAAGTEANVVPRLGAIRGSGKALIAGYDKLDRTIELLGGERDEPGAWMKLALCPEGAAHIGGYHTHVFG